MAKGERERAFGGKYSPVLLWGWAAGPLQPPEGIFRDWKVSAVTGEKLLS